MCQKSGSILNWTTIDTLILKKTLILNNFFVKCIKIENDGQLRFNF